MLWFSRPRLPAPLLAGAVILGSLVLTGSAAGTHVRPKAATPLFTSFVIAYQQCSVTNANHGPAFAFGSCAPPTPTSRWLTVGTADSNGKPTNFVGSSKLSVTAAPADIKADIKLSDVRCTPALKGANPALCPSGALNEYVGEVAVVYDLRISDHCNLPNIAVPPSCPVPAGTGNPIAATVLDFRFPIVVNVRAAGARSRIRLQPADVVQRGHRRSAVRHQRHDTDEHRHARPTRAWTAGRMVIPGRVRTTTPGSWKKESSSRRFEPISPAPAQVGAGPISPGAVSRSKSWKP